MGRNRNWTSESAYYHVLVARSSQSTQYTLLVSAPRQSTKPEKSQRTIDDDVDNYYFFMQEMKGPGGRGRNLCKNSGAAGGAGAGGVVHRLNTGQAFCLVVGLILKQELVFPFWEDGCNVGRAWRASVCGVA